MWSLIYTLTILHMCLSSSYADGVNITDYINSKKAAIMDWHEYFPNRTQETERLTIEAAIEAVKNLTDNMNASLTGIVTFQAQELNTAQLLMAGTNAEGCVKGIANYMSNAIADAISLYNDCTADANSTLYRQRTSLFKVRSTYLAAYGRVLKGIDACKNTYPNKDAFERLRSCVESMTANYMKVANGTTKILSPSPSMTFFQQSVLKYASEAANTVADKGSQFITMLTECAALCDTIDQEAYKMELGKWKGYNDTLPEQIIVSQTRNTNQTRGVEDQIIHYQQLRKDVLEKYMIEPRNLPYYLYKMYYNMRDYYNTITIASLDNPGDHTCAVAAREALDEIAYSYANQTLSCDIDIVNQTNILISYIRNIFNDLNKYMSITGNVTILNAISKGYIFAPGTIEQYTKLKLTNFDIVINDRQTSITNDVYTLGNFLTSFFNSSELPCGSVYTQKMHLECQTVLYNLERCLYISSGTEYTVTTPAPYSTSTKPYTTT